MPARRHYVWRLIKKEILHILRDRGLLIFIIYAFTLDIFLAAKGFQLIPEHISIGVLDEDRSVKSRELLGHIREPAFRKPIHLLSPEDIDRLLSDSEIILALVIPENFGKELRRQGAQVQVLVDGTQSTAAYLSTAYLAEASGRFNNDLVSRALEREGLGTSPPVELRSRILFNPDVRDDIYEGLNEFFMVVTLIGMILPAMLLIREREYGTLEQIMLSPLRVRDLVVIKLISAGLFLTAVTALSYIFVLKGWLRFPLKGSLPSFTLITAIYLVSTSGLAFIIGSIARRFSQIGMLTIVIFAPMLLLSGGWVPPEALPDWLRLATNISPLKQYIDLGVSLLIRGTPLTMLTEKIMRMIFLGIIFLTIGTVIFTRRLSRS